MLRTIVERCCRNLSFKRHIRVNQKKVPLYVSPDAQLKYLKFGNNAFDEDLIQVAENLLENNSVVWDIGANVGVFTFAAASVATSGTVLSVEADIWLAQLLRKTARLPVYKKSDICILPVAVSKEDTVSSFIIAKRGRASNSLMGAGGRSQMGGVREKQFVPALSLDTIVKSFSKPDFIKIDVEGAELMVVQGAQNIIQNVRPTFYIEIGEDVSVQLFNIFSENNYSAFSPSGENLQSKCAFNTFFIPNDKMNYNKTFSLDSLNLTG